MISKVVCAQVSFPVSVQMISAFFPPIPWPMQNPPVPLPGAEGVLDLSRPPSSFHLSHPCSLGPLRSVVLRGFRKRAPALPILSWARALQPSGQCGWQCGDKGHVVLVQASVWPVLARGPTCFSVARSRLEGHGPEEGALLPPQPEVQREPAGRPRLPSHRAGGQLGSKTEQE